MKICYKNIKLCGIYIENLYQKCYNARIQYVEGTKEFIRYSVPWKGRYFFMNQEDVQKLSNAANAKITLLKNDFFKYFMRAIMAGFFIVVAMIFSNVVGNVFSGAEESAWGKFLGALVFSIAVLLISLVGGELFTGNNLVMAFGAFDKKISWGDAAKVWVVSYIGNFVGCLILSLIFVWGGEHPEQQIILPDFIGNKACNSGRSDVFSVQFV